MRLQRGELQEAKDAVFACQVFIPAVDLAAFLALIPAPGRWFELGRAPETPPPPAESPGEAVSKRASPVQVIAPNGFDTTRLGQGRSLPKEVLLTLLLVRDPLFQEWVLELTREPYNAVPDAVEFAAQWVSRELGVPSLFEIPPEKLAAIAPLQERFSGWLVGRRGVAPPVSAG